MSILRMLLRKQAGGKARKEVAKVHFLRLLVRYHTAKQDISTPFKKRRFIMLSAALHAAKAGVPKSWWSLI